MLGIRSMRPRLVFASISGWALQRGMRLHLSGQPRRARRWYALAASCGVNRHGAFGWWGLASILIGRPRTAHSLLRRAMRDAPRSDGTALLAAACADNSGDRLACRRNLLLVNGAALNRLAGRPGDGSSPALWLAFDAPDRVTVDDVTGMPDVLQGHLRLQSVPAPDTWPVRPLPPLADAYAQVRDGDVILNLLGDADVLGASLVRLATNLRRVGARVVNEPSAVEACARDRIAHTIGRVDGIECVSHLRVGCGPHGCGARAVTAALDAGLVTFPLTVRPAGSHGGRGLERHEGLESLRGSRLLAGCGDAYVANWRDCRETSGLFSKTRLLIIGNQMLVEHHYYGSDWVVNEAAAHRTMGRRTDLAALACRRMAAIEKMIECDSRFALLRERIGLDLCAVDGHFDAANEFLVFEATPTFRLPSIEQTSLREPHLLPAHARIDAALRALIAMGRLPTESACGR